MTVYMRPGQSVSGFLRELPAKVEAARPEKPRPPTHHHYEAPVTPTRLELLAIAPIAMGLSTVLIYVGFVR